MDVPARRALLCAVIDCVFVERGRLRPEERITICPAGTAPAYLPSRRDKKSRIQPFRGPLELSDHSTLSEWDPAVLRRRLRSFTRGHQAWPAASELCRRGRAALYRQAAFQGGERYWASQLGLAFTATNQRSGSWTEERIHATLRVVLDGLPAWPSFEEFDALGLKQLHVAIRRSGGSQHWASEFSVPFAHYPKGYWTDDTIRQTLTQFCRGRTYFPTSNEFKQANLGGLLAVLAATHSRRRWANEIGLPYKTDPTRILQADCNDPIAQQTAG